MVHTTSIINIYIYIYHSQLNTHTDSKTRSPTRSTPLRATLTRSKTSNPTTVMVSDGSSSTLHFPSAYHLDSVSDQLATESVGILSGEPATKTLHLVRLRIGCKELYIYIYILYKKTILVRSIRFTKNYHQHRAYINNIQIQY